MPRRGRHLMHAIGAMGSALLMFLGMPPCNLWPLGLVALVPLWLVIRDLSAGPAFGWGWACGLAINLVGQSWSMSVVQRFAGVSAPTAIGIWFVICAYQALVFALWAGGTRWLAGPRGIPALVAAPLTMAIVETVVPFLFPWYLGVAAWRAWPVQQVAELGGAPAVSALLVLIAGTAAELVHARLRREWIGRSVWTAMALGVAIFATGVGRSAQIASARGRAARIHVGIVQPNFGIVTVEARKRHGAAYLTTLRHATDELGRRGADLVIWPESAFPFLFDRKREREFAAGHPWELRQSFRKHLLFGALTHVFGTPTVRNSAILVSPEGRIAGRYDELRLLAFAEFTPLAERLPAWAERIEARPPEAPAIEPGDGPHLLTDGPLRILAMVSYDELLADSVLEGARLGPGPNLLVTVANHAWFGNSWAPEQALALATLRSIETRRDLVRATSTGVSSIGDALGRVHIEGALLDVPRDHPAAPTLLEGDVALVDVVAIGPWTAPIFPFACGGALLVLLVRHRKTRAGP